MNQKTSQGDFLAAVYKELDFESSLGFYIPSSHPSDISETDVVNKFGWLKLADQLNADRVFFIDNFPVALFFELGNEEELHELHIKVWNMSRAPYIFVALPGEIRIYNVYEKPIKDPDEWNSKNRWLARVKDITRVVEALNEYSRQQLESERALQNLSLDHRADKWLLRNLRLLRRRLEEDGLSLIHTLNLVSRSIFIRYLEDREVLLPEYFSDLTDGRANSYVEVLESKSDTFNLYRKLGSDFNGDIFPITSSEERAVTKRRLALLRQFLNGQAMSEQEELFFWAYRFDVIPVELISSIYEEFYHSIEDDQRGTYYTPEVLVDFVLQKTFDNSLLEAGRVIDLACGSGIFLVEAFRRIVHFRMGKRKQRLRPNELKKILLDRIFGIDINGAAIRVAAFSLYLTLLDYMEPSDIRKHQLPALLYDASVNSKAHASGNLFEANAFWLTDKEKTELNERLKSNRYAGRARDEDVSTWPTLPIEENQFDMIVGNPPWGSPDSNDLEAEKSSNWAASFNYPIGDKELSQCFIWRAQSLLGPKGKVGLLVSSGIISKHNQTSRTFRQKFLSTNILHEVYNFSHVRRSFFTGGQSSAISPFLAIFFSPNTSLKSSAENSFAYVSIKQTRLVENLQAVTFDKSDLHFVPQFLFLERDDLWKVLQWGTFQDFRLIQELESNKKLSEYVSDQGRGYEDGGRKVDHTRDLSVTIELPTKHFGRRIDYDKLQSIVPRKLHYTGNTQLYHKRRLLIKRGITERGEKLAEIVATISDKSFAFRNSIHALRLGNLSLLDQKVILGIIWSNLALYYHFLTSSTWGYWRHEIHLSEHLRLPIMLPENEKLKERIARIVEDLLIAQDGDPTLFDPNKLSIAGIEEELNSAIFELYRLSDEDIDLIADFYTVNLDYFYNGVESKAFNSPDVSTLEEYKKAFKDIWESHLLTRERELETILSAPSGSPLIGISFELVERGNAEDKNIFNASSWKIVFQRLSEQLPQQISKRIYIDRVIKYLAKSSMLIIKRSESRLWTKSQARRDAYEMISEVIKLETESLNK